jgi:L-fucose isomerase-like protein
MIRRNATFGIIIATRGFFNADLARNGRKEILDMVSALGFDAVILPENATPTGAVEGYDDALKCAKLFRENADKIDGVIVSLPNFGDELGVINSLKLSKLNVPILVQASDDELDKVDVKHRRDSFCGKLSVCNNLRQYGMPFSLTSLHTCPVNSPEFEADLRKFAAVCRVVSGLRTARIGAIGARPAAFQTVRASEKMLQASGITVIPVDLSEIMGMAEKIETTSADGKNKLKEIRDYGPMTSAVTPGHLDKHVKFGLAIDRWIAENGIDAAGIQCWTSIQNNFGCSACLTMSMLSNKLTPAACEVDVCGAVSMYALSLASGNAPALIDWNNNYGTDRNKCVAQHCSNYPKDFVKSGITIGHPEVLSMNLGGDNCTGGISGKVAAGPFTYFRMSTDDTAGKIRSYVGEAEFTDDPFNMSGGIAVCMIPDLQGLFRFICREGLEHHVAMARGYVAEIVEEAVVRYLGWQTYKHG